MKLEGGFINNLSKVYGIYTLGFLGFVILMAILEQVGVSADAIGWMFVGFTIAIYALIGVLSRTMESGQYYVAGREVPAVFNGMATAADWMSGASFIAMAGGIYLKGYPYMAFLVGWTGGYVLVASLLATAHCKSPYPNGVRCNLRRRNLLCLSLAHHLHMRDVASKAT